MTGLSEREAAKLRKDLQDSLRGPLIVHEAAELLPLPEVTEIKRWEYRPGDRLIVHTDIGKVNAEQAHEIITRVKGALQLPENAPVAIAGKGWTFEVISEID